MSKLNLDTGAKFFLAALQNRGGTIDRALEQQIGEACAKKGAPLKTGELQALLTQAMPDRQADIGAVAKACAGSSYHADGCKADFVTQQIGLLIEKERAAAVRPPRRNDNNVRWTRDPLYAKFVMDNDAHSIALFNGRDVDENGQPLLMKVVLRVTDPENAELVEQEKAAFIEQMGGFEDFRTKWRSPDIEVVPRDATYVETKDIQENEFEFGDPLFHVSFDHRGGEISRGVTVDPENRLVTKFYLANGNGEPNLARPAAGHADNIRTGRELDATRPSVFDHRIQLHMKRKADAPQGGWLDDAKGDQVDMKLLVEPGLFFEPGKKAQVSYEGAQVETEVPADDAFFLGAPSGEAAVDPARLERFTLKQLLERSVTWRVDSTLDGAQDTASRNARAVDLIYPRPAAIHIGGKDLRPLEDRAVLRNDLEAAKIAVSMSPRPCEGGPNATTLHLKLDEGFLAAAEGSSVDGWQVVVGFVNEEGEWQQAKPVEVCDRHRSGAAKLELETQDIAKLMQQNKQLELRVFNDRGVPAQRLQIPFVAIPWADKVLP